jgi:hypothetical protein
MPTGFLNGRRSAQEVAASHPGERASTRDGYERAMPWRIDLHSTGVMAGPRGS